MAGLKVLIMVTMIRIKVVALEVVIMHGDFGDWLKLKFT